ncbi:helix-turn-helix domain-containing protein [Jejuia spongiicola]|uniref:AraC family transcriptional regulator n=1 Tax=Jejuia spongiicola TaxID=2942207 RepID=A0ABT0QHK1_9FLAO|nr:AraC family transcriptional regulator [Jejuia spongiicola]MCL6296471.1 AraC family transcriptional regulator [Jejuia spongiicola]
MNDLNFNIYNITIISGVIQGFIFSLIVLTQKKYITNNTIYLGLVVLFLSLSNLQYWFLDTQLANVYSFIKLIYIPWHWLVLPMFYLYVHKFIGRKKLNYKIKLILILPFFIVLLIHITYILLTHSSDSINKIASHFQRGIYVYIEFLSFIFNILIMVFVYRMILKHERDKSYDITWVKSETNWLKKLIYTGVIVCFCWFCALIIVVIYNLNKSYIFYPMWIGISVLVYWIGYVGINKSKDLKKRIELRKKRISILKKSKLVPNLQENSKGFYKLEIYIKGEKKYLNPNLTLKAISKELSLSEGYLSQLINKNTDSNFNDYINLLRIGESKEMLANPDYNNYTIVAIGLESGFNSKSSFYSAFKKHTGKTPMEYKKDVRNP